MALSNRWYITPSIANQYHLTVTTMDLGQIQKAITELPEIRTMILPEWLWLVSPQ